jgi:uncharacterized protein (PEP-CTERM system associated)
MKCRLASAMMLTFASSAQAQQYEYDLRSKFEREALKETMQPGFFYQPRIESALMLVGNINLAEDAADEIDVAGIEVAPGIYTSYLTPRTEAFLDYSLIGRVWEDDDYDEVSHRLNASGAYLVDPEWFRVQARASYMDSVLDPTRSSNYGGMGVFGQSNLSEVATASVSPQLFHDFRDFRLDAQYTYGRVWFLDNKDITDQGIFSLYEDDSIDQKVLLSLKTRGDARGTTGRVFYEWQDSDFENTVGYRYERVGAEAGLRLARTLRFVGDGGLESDLDESTVAGGLDSVFWHAGLEWRPDERTTMDARYGERFFGDSWSLSLSRETRYVTMRVSYNEDPDVETRRVGINLDPGGPPIENPGFDLSGFTSYPFVGKTALASLLAEGARTKLRLDVYDRKREYINNFPPDEQTQGVRFNALRDLGAYLYAEFDTRYEDVLAGRRGGELGDNITTFQDYDWEVMGRLTWEAYENFKVAGEAGYLSRSGDTNYTGQWLALRLRYDF